MAIWSKLDRLLRASVGGGDLHAALDTMLDVVRNHLELVFHRYLSGEEGIAPVLRVVEDGGRRLGMGFHLVRPEARSALLWHARAMVGFHPAIGPSIVEKRNKVGAPGANGKSV